MSLLGTGPIQVFKRRHNRLAIVVAQRTLLDRKILDLRRLLQSMLALQLSLDDFALHWEVLTPRLFDDGLQLLQVAVKIAEHDLHAVI